MRIAGAVITAFLAGLPIATSSTGVFGQTGIFITCPQQVTVGVSKTPSNWKEEPRGAGTMLFVKAFAHNAGPGDIITFPYSQDTLRCAYGLGDKMYISMIQPVPTNAPVCKVSASKPNQFECVPRPWGRRSPSH
jgi:hypothetical protein